MTNKQQSVVRRAIVTPDKHFPIHDKKAIKVRIIGKEEVQNQWRI